MHWRVVKVRLLWMEAEVAALEGLKARLDTRTHVHACARARKHTHTRAHVLPQGLWQLLCAYHCAFLASKLQTYVRICLQACPGARVPCKSYTRACPEARDCLLTGSFLVLGAIFKPKPVLEPGLGTGPVLGVFLGP